LSHRILAVLAPALLTLFFAGCGSDSSTSTGGSRSAATPRPSASGAHPSGAAAPQYCAQNLDPKCTPGSYVGPFVSLSAGGGYWDDNGNPVDGGPIGADGSTGNKLSQEYCAQNENPACPVGSYVAPNAIKNPDGSHTYVTCEGTICTNPNHGGADPPGEWGPEGQPVDGGPIGADGSTGNNLSHEYCAQNESPACPVGSYVGPNAIENPDGTNSFVPCEGTICTNPNHGGGDPPAVDNPPGSGDCEGTICTNPNHGAGTDPSENGGAEMPNPNGDGSVVPCEGTICTNPNHGGGDDSDESAG